MKQFWENIEKIGVILSIIISAIAIIISIRSCGNSNAALEISKKEYQSKRDLVLESKEGYVVPGFVFRPFNSNQKLQRIIVYLPQNFSKNEVYVEPPQFQYYLSEIEESLQQVLIKTAKQYVSRNILNIPSVLVPIIIKSNYVVGGENLWDISLYDLEFSYQFNSRNESDSYLEFKNLMFVGKWVDENDFTKTLNKFWLSNFKELLNKLNKM